MSLPFLTFFLVLQGSFFMANDMVEGAPPPLRIMALNSWFAGSQVDDGLAKIAKHIEILQPDIVALQEISWADSVPKLTTLLGPKIWKGVIHSSTDTAILTRHKFLDDTSRSSLPSWGIGTSVLLDSDVGHVINFFSLHLDWRSYGPHAVDNKNITNKEEIFAGEKGRVQNVVDLLADAKFKEYAAKTGKQPLIVAGDFNTPSHLDYIEETKDMHHGWVLEWPATKMLADAGLTDSFRQVHPNVTQNPGLTWSTVYKSDGPEHRGLPEPQDRIDYVMYKSSQLKPINTMIYSGKEPLVPMPNAKANDWPSDHYALVVDFEWDLKVQEGCDEGWTEFNGQCWKAFADTRWNQTNAMEICHSSDGQLASIHGPEENQFLIGLMDAADPSKESSFWLGMEVRFSSADNKIIGAYWLDGTSTAFGHPEMVEAGDYPWGQYKNQNPEPDYRNSNQIQPGVIFARDPDSIITPGWAAVARHYATYFVCKKKM